MTFTSKHHFRVETTCNLKNESKGFSGKVVKTSTKKSICNIFSSRLEGLTSQERRRVNKRIKKEKNVLFASSFKPLALSGRQSLDFDKSEPKGCLEIY
ncbi:CLUMA_CG010768, isoform A [Clunio marinus]|uniref:CLUMA_CG010768, isoform A n=1 Tax=Clunio marinus TaxID=568069 RepID=A0A1J1IC99_9DIPT|nr:CLUMA_CG010768, isoform A [Clunio marinus]